MNTNSPGTGDLCADEVTVSPSASAHKRRLRVVADEYAGLVVVGGEEGVDRARRVRRAVEGDDEHTPVARLLARRR